MGELVVICWAVIVPAISERAVDSTSIVPAPRDVNEPVAFICGFQFFYVSCIQATGN